MLNILAISYKIIYYLFNKEGRPRECTRATSPTANQHRQYLGAVSPPEPPPLSIVDLPEDIPHEALEALRRHHRYRYSYYYI